MGTEKIGETPISLEMMEGSHSISLIKDGFKAWDGSIEAVADVDQVRPTVQLEPANAQLRVSSIPRGANVTVNGRYRGQSPVTIALSPEVNYEIGLSKAGYGSTSRRVRLDAAASEEITVDMTAKVGEVTVAVLPGDATVFVDGQARGTGNVTVKLSSAPHRLEVRKDGYATYSRTVTPRPGYPQTIQVRLMSDAELLAQSTASTIKTSQGQELKRVEPGEFTMGTSRREQGRRANEVLVPVLITRPYFFSTREVTNREFRRFRPNHDSSGALHVSLAGDLNPVVSVTWDDAVEYLNWLSVQEGLTPAYTKVFQRWQPVTPTPNGYRLPTEAEWTWAIRYETRRNAATFPWGDRMPPRRDSGNYAGRSANALVASILPGWDDGYASTAPVGTFPPNSIGIYDGGGNVAEWVQDYYSVPTPGQTEPVKDPQGPSRGSNRVIRGSSWMNAGILELRLGYRNYGSSGYADVGFRIARNVE
jgi:formylglycine-generating enzyme required for sulfatase activity